MARPQIRKSKFQMTRDSRDNAIEMLTRDLSEEDREMWEGILKTARIWLANNSLKIAKRDLKEATRWNEEHRIERSNQEIERAQSQIDELTNA